MQYRRFGSLGFEVSALGLGCMRLPRILGEDGSAEVDRERAYALIRHAIDTGINYIDTALTYHHGTSEAVVGEALAGGYRERVKLATKQMVSIMHTPDDARRNLENTLKDLRTDHLDNYLVHNISPANWELVQQRNVFKLFEEFRREGLIRHIGFSYHGDFATYQTILEAYPWEMCQVQQNILDTDKEATEEAIRLAGRRNVALVIMEPLRGGGLVTPPPAVQQVYDSAETRRSPVEWAFRHLIDYPEVSCILSGMTTIEQLDENISIFSDGTAMPGCLTQQERAMLRDVKKAYEAISSIPCTSCEYCVPCPQGVSIPEVFLRYNQGVMYDNFDPSRRWYMLLKRFLHDAARCVACGACEQKCPQHIPIIETLQKCHTALDGWAE